MTPPSPLAEVDTFWTPAREEALDAVILQFPERRQVVGLHGFAQSGKDTIAGILRQHGYSQVVLAEPILQALILLNPIVAVDNRGRLHRFSDVYAEEGYEGAKKTPEFRRLMQVFGSEVGRQYLGDLLGVDTWIDIARAKMKPAGRYAVSDVRFRDEVEMVRSMGGTLIKVTRPGYGPVNGHISDAGLPDELFDYVIDNDGTIDDLHTKVREALGL